LIFKYKIKQYKAISASTLTHKHVLSQIHVTIQSHFKVIHTIPCERWQHVNVTLLESLGYCSALAAWSYV